MGEVSKTKTMMMMKKKKKKGRPSLLDLQKRFLKQQKLQQQQQPKPNDLNFAFNPSHSSSHRDPATDCFSGDGDDDDDERKEKKQKLLLGLTSRQNYPTLSEYSVCNSASNVSDSNLFGDDSEAALKRRKIGAVHFGSNHVGEKGFALKETDTGHGSQVEYGPTTTLPDKKLLCFILDRLQKKDTHGVFSEPVDPEELPDYHDTIENPMDFGTVRAKLDGGAYTYLEQFEKDIFLICSNAMKYNAPDTVFFRQARCMQELAKKDFDNLRRDSDDSEPEPEPEPEPEQKVVTVRRGRPPGKSQKGFLGNPLECIGTDLSSGATPPGCDNSISVNGYNLRRGCSSLRSLPVDPLVRTSTCQHGETLTSWLSEWKNEFPASVLKSVLKNGKNGNIAVDENRRDTYYNHSLSSGNWPSVSATLNGELRQLIAVGLHAEQGYARSLAMFAAGLGPVVWKIVSKKMGSLHRELGSAWSQESEMLGQQGLLSVDRKPSENAVVAENTGRLLCRSSTSDSNFDFSNSLLKHNQDTGFNRERNSQSETISLGQSRGGMGSTPYLLKEQKTPISTNIRRLNGDFEPHFPQEMRMVRLDDIMGMPCAGDSSMPCQMHTMSLTHDTASCQIPASDMDSSQAEISRLSDGSQYRLSRAYYVQESTKAPEMMPGGKAHWQELATQHHMLDSITYNPDLNVGLGLSVSSSSNVPILSQMQPDLVLQL